MESSRHMSILCSLRRCNVVDKVEIILILASGGIKGLSWFLIIYVANDNDDTEKSEEE